MILWVLEVTWSIWSVTAFSNFRQCQFLTPKAAELRRTDWQPCDATKINSARPLIMVVNWCKHGVVSHILLDWSQFSSHGVLLGVLLLVLISTGRSRYIPIPHSRTSSPVYMLVFCLEIVWTRCALANRHRIPTQHLLWPGPDLTMLLGSHVLYFFWMICAKWHDTIWYDLFINIRRCPLFLKWVISLQTIKATI